MWFEGGHCFRRWGWFGARNSSAHVEVRASQDVLLAAVDSIVCGGMYSYDWRVCSSRRSLLALIIIWEMSVCKAYACWASRPSHRVFQSRFRRALFSCRILSPRDPDPPSLTSQKFWCSCVHLIGMVCSSSRETRLRTSSLSFPLNFI